MSSNDPLDLLGQALARAEAADPLTWNAMSLATVDPDGRPSVRIVLMKGLDARGLAFYTNLSSRKSAALRVNPYACVNFFWGVLEEQVRIDGPVEPTTDAESDAYFATRPRGSQIGAWASLQSSPLDARATLDARVAEFERRFDGQPVPRPPTWGGWRLLPRRIEFWKAHPSRLHDRTEFTRTSEGWSSRKLYP